MEPKLATTPRFNLYYRSTQAELDTQFVLSLLDQHELNRYHRFKVEPPRKTFLLARWILKVELARRLGISPADVRLAYNENGKPRLADEFGDQHVFFSLAHSQQAVVVGIGDCECGVDLEELARLQRIDQKTESFIGVSAALQIKHLANNSMEKDRYFAMFWTIMESIVKLRGSTLFKEQAMFDLRLKQGQYFFPQSDYHMASYLLEDSVVSYAVDARSIDRSLWRWHPCGEHQPMVYEVLAKTDTFTD